MRKGTKLFTIYKIYDVQFVFFLFGEIASSKTAERDARILSVITLSGKTITEIPEYDSGLMDKEKIEHSTMSRDNRRIFIYLAGYRRALDK